MCSRMLVFCTRVRLSLYSMLVLILNGYTWLAILKISHARMLFPLFGSIASERSFLERRRFLIKSPYPPGGLKPRLSLRAPPHPNPLTHPPQRGILSRRRDTRHKNTEQKTKGAQLPYADTGRKRREPSTGCGRIQSREARSGQLIPVVPISHPRLGERVNSKSVAGTFKLLAHGCSSLEIS